MISVVVKGMMSRGWWPGSFDTRTTSEWGLASYALPYQPYLEGAQVIGGRAAIALAISAWHSRAVRQVVDVAVSAEDIIVCGSAIESLLRCPEYGPVQPSRAALACA